MRTRLIIFIAGSIGLAMNAGAADPLPVRLVVKPLLCVIDKDETACTINFDVRWKSTLEAEYCLNDSARPTPLRCWPRGDSGEHSQERVVTEDFVFWLSPPAGVERVAEAKVEVLRVGSDDRRRERRTRHVWDVL
jgi:hypothetical protein